MGVPSASNSPSALSAQALRARARIFCPTLIFYRFVQNREGASGPPNNRRFKHSITVKEVTVEATAKKKKDAKNLAFKLMAVKLGEILRLLKPQPGRQTMLHVRPEKS